MISFNIIQMMKRWKGKFYDSDHSENEPLSSVEESMLKCFFKRKSNKLLEGHRNRIFEPQYLDYC